MCEERTCRPCKLEDRLLDRAMGSNRVYIKSKMPSIDERVGVGTMIQLNLLSSSRKSINKPRHHV
ncbi:hypothetical protein SEA_RICKMORE_48 [Gordonia phage Rickmore]|uniref:Uncharacterized protein n=1 Tax=Gordonia phage Rickmore TaxID=2507854 RepID=A0A410TB96_9CAUD|nr:hypothetical protein HWC05_gp48 [Gordonia phage Rickmore]QAU06282.1 hypothetical protein SEA_RICKMORE_48 [Gordonia phage Rickmore]